MITSRFLKKKKKIKKEEDLDNKKNHKHILIKKISTAYEMSIAKSKLNTYLFMHHKIKRDRRRRSKK